METQLILCGIHQGNLPTEDVFAINQTFPIMRRVILINIQVLLVLVILLNIMAYGLLSWRDANHQIKASDILPNYTNVEEFLKLKEEMSKLKMEYNEYDGWKTLAYDGEYLDIDSSGFRQVIPPNKEKIRTAVFLGGSVMWGFYCKDVETIPSYFAQEQDSFQVKNYAERGFHSRQGLIRLINQISTGVNPDLVISMDGINDALQFCFEDTPITSHVKGDGIRDLINKAETRETKSIVQNGKSVLYALFFEHTHLVLQRLKIKWTGDKSHGPQYHCHEDKYRSELVANQLIRNWEMMHEIVEGKGGQFIAILQPVTAFSKARVDHFTANVIQKKQALAVYPLIKQKIKELEYDWIYDFTSIFDDENEAYIFVDECHVSPNGNQIIGHEILKLLKLDKE